IALHPALALSKLPGPALGSILPRYRERDRPAIPDWSLAQARAALKEAAKDRDRLIDVTLQFARRTFEFSAAFAMLRGAACLWEIRGEPTDPQVLSRPAIPIDVPSIFRTVCTTRRSYAGPMPADPLTRKYLEQIGRSPRTIFLFPVEVGGRL